MTNYYSVLSVQENASQAEIKKAYRNLMRKWHPDVNRSRDATSRTEGVNKAYAVLSCRESRYNHDIQLREAGLSSKPLYKKTEIPCLDCQAKGFVKYYKKNKWNSIKKLFGYNIPYEKHMCFSCCGTGWERRIQEY